MGSKDIGKGGVSVGRGKTRTMVLGCVLLSGEAQILVGVVENQFVWGQPVVATYLLTRLKITFILVFHTHNEEFWASTYIEVWQNQAWWTCMGSVWVQDRKCCVGLGHC